MVLEAFSVHSASAVNQFSLISIGLPNAQQVLGNSSFLQVCIAINVITNLPSVAQILLKGSSKSLVEASNKSNKDLANLLESGTDEQKAFVLSIHSVIESEYNLSCQRIKSRSEAWFQVFRHIGNIFAFIALGFIYFEYYTSFDVILALTWLIYIIVLNVIIYQEINKFNKVVSFSKVVKKQLELSNNSNLESQKKAEEYAKEINQEIRENLRKSKSTSETYAETPPISTNETLNISQKIKTQSTNIKIVNTRLPNIKPASTKLPNIKPPTKKIKATKQADLIPKKRSKKP
jgi:hypothetical protein